MDLVISLDIENLRLRAYAGQPQSLFYKVTNFDPGSISLFNWSDSVYLSIDGLLDPFDIRLVTEVQSHIMPLNSSYVGFLKFSLPFSLFETKYYLLLKVDNKEIVYDTNKINNIASVLLSIIGNEFVLDLVVSNLVVSKNVQYGKNIEANWIISNNGTENALGCKCDSLYLSEDIIWDFDDTEVATSCSFMSILSKNFQRESLVEFVPLVKQSSFSLVVKTQSSVLDFNISNHEVVSLTPTIILHFF